MKKYLIAIVVIIGLALIAWRTGKVPALNNLLPAGDGQPVACTMEAKQCPDGSYVGRSGPKCEFTACSTATAEVTPPFNEVTYVCDGGEIIDAKLEVRSQTLGHVQIKMSDRKETLVLSQTISASGARYANGDESFVFWNKGDTAFVTENGSITFANCASTPTTMNFLETGNIVIQNGDRYLVYEKLGAPALKVRLISRGGSSSLQNGDRVTVQGELRGGVVLVGDIGRIGSEITPVSN